MNRRMSLLTASVLWGRPKTRLDLSERARSIRHVLRAGFGQVQTGGRSRSEPRPIQARLLPESSASESDSLPARIVRVCFPSESGCVSGGNSRNMLSAGFFNGLSFQHAGLRVEHAFGFPHGHIQVSVIYAQLAVLLRSWSPLWLCSFCTKSSSLTLSRTCSGEGKKAPSLSSLEDRSPS